MLLSVPFKPTFESDYFFNEPSTPRPPSGLDDSNAPLSSPEPEQQDSNTYLRKSFNQINQSQSQSQSPSTDDSHPPPSSPVPIPTLLPAVVSPAIPRAEPITVVSAPIHQQSPLIAHIIHVSTPKGSTTTHCSYVGVDCVPSTPVSSAPSTCTSTRSHGSRSPPPFELAAPHPNIPSQHTSNTTHNTDNRSSPSTHTSSTICVPIDSHSRRISGHVQRVDGSAVEYVGPFILGAVLGRGCTGTVRLGTHKRTGFEVAFKIIEKKYLNSDPKLWKKVKREIVILKLIEHPHVLKLYDVLETENRLYLVLEHVKGGELFDYIVSKGRLGRDESLRLTAQIVMGLQHCHQHNICHRDLKPENLLLEEDKSTGTRNIKIADFGMAQMIKKDSMLKTSCGCFDPDTEILLANGGTIQARHLQPHHRLIGSNGQSIGIVPHTLMGTTSFPMPPAPGYYYAPATPGEQPVWAASLDQPRPHHSTMSAGWKRMKVIQPLQTTFEPYTVSDNHILTVGVDMSSDCGHLNAFRRHVGDDGTSLRLLDYTVDEYLDLPSSYHDHLSGVKYSKPIEFSPVNRWFECCVHSSLVDSHLPTGQVKGVHYDSPLRYRAALIVNAVMYNQNSELAHIMHEPNYRQLTPSLSTRYDKCESPCIFPPSAQELQKFSTIDEQVQYVQDYIVKMCAWLVGVWQAVDSKHKQSLFTFNDMNQHNVNLSSAIFHRSAHLHDLIGTDRSQPSILFSLLTHCELVDTSSDSATSHENVRMCDGALPARLGFQHAPVAVRLALLSGIIDGNSNFNAKQHQYEVVSQTQQFSEWVCALLRQTGFNSQRPDLQNDGLWHIAKISAHVQHLQSLQCACDNKRIVAASQGQDLPFDNPFTNKFHIADEMIGYYSVVTFQVDSDDQRFLLADGTIVHNSPHYASPQVIEGKEYDAKITDVWSIGVILFALITGSLPFDHDNIPTLLSMVTKGVYTTPSYVPHDISHLISRMLTVDPDKRITIEEIKKHPAFKNTNHFDNYYTDGLDNVRIRNTSVHSHKSDVRAADPSSIKSKPEVHSTAPSDDHIDDSDMENEVDEAVLNDLESLGLGKGSRDELKHKIKQEAPNKEPSLESVFYKLLRKRKINRLRELSVLSPKLGPSQPDPRRHAHHSSRHTHSSHRHTSHSSQHTNDEHVNTCASVPSSCALPSQPEPQFATQPSSAKTSDNSPATATANSNQLDSFFLPPAHCAVKDSVNPASLTISPRSSSQSAACANKDVAASSITTVDSTQPSSIQATPTSTASNNTPASAASNASNPSRGLAQLFSAATSSIIDIENDLNTTIMTVPRRMTPPALNMELAVASNESSNPGSLPDSPLSSCSDSPPASIPHSPVSSGRVTPVNASAHAYQLSRLNAVTPDSFTTHSEQCSPFSASNRPNMQRRMSTPDEATQHHVYNHARRRSSVVCQLLFPDQSDTNHDSDVAPPPVEFTRSVSESSPAHASGADDVPHLSRPVLKVERAQSESTHPQSDENAPSDFDRPLSTPSTVVPHTSESRPPRIRFEDNNQGDADEESSSIVGKRSSNAGAKECHINSPAHKKSWFSNIFGSSFDNFLFGRKPKPPSPSNRSSISQSNKGLTAVYSHCSPLMLSSELKHIFTSMGMKWDVKKGYLFEVDFVPSALHSPLPPTPPSHRVPSANSPASPAVNRPRSSSIASLPRDIQPPSSSTRTPNLSSRRVAGQVRANAPITPNSTTSVNASLTTTPLQSDTVSTPIADSQTTTSVSSSSSHAEFNHSIAPPTIQSTTSHSNPSSPSISSQVKPNISPSLPPLSISSPLTSSSSSSSCSTPVDLRHTLSSIHSPVRFTIEITEQPQSNIRAVSFCRRAGDENHYRKIQAYIAQKLSQAHAAHPGAPLNALASM